MGELQKALRILEQALGSHATVVRPAKPRAQPADVLTVRVERASNPAATLRLVPWQAEVRPGDGTIVWVVSPRDRAALDRLRLDQESYIDLRGAVHLILPWLVVDRTGISPPRTDAAPAANPFSDRNSLVLRSLLADPGRAWGVRQLAAAAGVTPGTASKVVQRLTLDRLVETTGAGRNTGVRVTSPRRVLRRWTRSYDWQRNRRAAFSAPIGDPERFIRRLGKTFGDTRWALTLQAGASLVAPHATWDRVHVYVDAERYDETVDAASANGWTPSADGRLVLMKPYYRESIWRGARTVDGCSVVSDLQLALDLWEYPLRGREQAEHLLDVVLRWRSDD